MSKNKFWQFRSQADDSKVGELLLYGVIDSTTWWGDEITPQMFKKDLESLGAINILNIYINSPGGDPFAAHAMFNIVKRHKEAKNLKSVDVYIDGIAASAASDFAMVGDTIYMPGNSIMMIHKPYTWGMGNSKALRKMADDLDKVEESCIFNYKSKTGLDEDKIKKLLDAETWMTAKEAKELGFADVIEEDKKVAACIAAGVLMFNGQKMDFSRYKNAPKILVTEAKEQEILPIKADPIVMELLEKDINSKKNKYSGGIKK